MRASRLLSILLLLQTRGRMTAQALADEFEISVRTLYRDIDDLSAAGVPVYGERGRAGGFQLLNGYRTRLTGLTPTEIQAMFLIGLPGPAAELGLGDAMADARLKLMAALPGEVSERAGIAGRFHLDPVAWFRNSERADTLPALARAVWNGLRIRISYETWTKTVERDLEPLGLALKAGIWYLVAQARGKPRTYRVSAIGTLAVSEETFTRPEDFDLSRYWATWAKDFEARLHRGEASLKVSPEGLKRLATLTPAVDGTAARAEPLDERGWIQIDIPIESIDHAAREMLKLGAEAEILAPPELRQAMIELTARLGAIYQTGSDAPD